ncbi:MAG TPA: bifunctional phosphoribosylaminoimidazolecarboxamide formyltransferase/IMP cyclohydrolase [Gammaproteobacteria bacterium]|nr:bifunctional phosphoribosylaminoimidazolecarboxamide formyltransferase/IMP cyclohydrolase [Gammaproteobacteria bacterium]
MNIIPVKRALLSVSDKTGIVAFAQALTALNVEIISTGGTSQLLTQAQIPHRVVEEVTGFPEILDGRVKTLHPKVHGGILGRRDIHAQEAKQHQIDWIDLVVVNFYPFAEAVKDADLSWEEAVEYIDIGGPTMVRAAAKNFAWVGAVVDPEDYTTVLAELHTQGGLTKETRIAFAQKVFTLTARYDAMVQQYFTEKRAGAAANSANCPASLQLQLIKKSDLRYGENPHQKAAVYQLPQVSGILSAIQHQGKLLSYNNLLDAEAAWACVREFEAPTCVIVKHANPCGVASAASIDQAYAAAYAADALSAFGGIIALNRPCTKAIAEAVANIFMEVILAPAYDADALAVLATKPNLRVLEMPDEQFETWEMRFITGGLLLQEKDIAPLTIQSLPSVTKIQPSDEDKIAMQFAWRVVKHIKSNAILLAKQTATLGVGAGQVSRVDAVDMAVRKAGENIQGAILASDAFFPFRDSIDRIAELGIRAIIQPGGSVRDEEVIAACNEHGIAMVFTGKRCFKH